VHDLESTVAARPAPAAEAIPRLESDALSPETAPPQESRPKTLGYFDQILPEADVVCGLALKPLSIGRYRRMKRQQLRFVSDEAIQIEESELVGDLLKGVLICSMTCATYDRFMAQPDAARQVKKWAQQQGFLPERYHDWGFLGRWFVKYIVGPEVTRRRDQRAADYLIEQVARFRHYIAEGSRVPAHWEESGESRASAAHWSHSIESVLREKQHWSKEEIDEEPLPKALWDYFKTMETAGMVRLMGEAEAAELARQLTPEEEAESAATLKALWEYKFPGVPMPTG